VTAREPTEVILRDLATRNPQPEIRLSEREWLRVRKILKSRKLLGKESLRKLAESPGGIQVDRKASEQLALDYMLRKVRPETAPKATLDVGPMATLNGVWIDPVVAVMMADQKRMESAQQEVLRVILFFIACRGFTILS
jgi:hypothetical protein